MTKLDGKTPDLAAENIEQLRQIFPDVFEEGKIDFDKLKQVLGEYVDDEKERYNFTWNGKGKALRLAQTPTTGTLRPCEAESKNWDDTQNLYIEGDNLEVLKLLQKSYHGKIKMIYIDPPYNTGGDFVYPDDFSDSIENYKRITGQVDDEGKRLGINSEFNGRYHTDWLNMMYPRLRLARNLLTKDGAIFISIDDNELANLIKLCDEVFGEDNFISDFIWEKRYTRNNDAKLVSTVIDHVVCYRKSSNLEKWREPRSEKQNLTYSNPDNDPRGVWTSVLFTSQRTKEERPNLSYAITNPITGATVEHPTNAWKYSREQYEKLQSENRLYWGKDGGNSYPRIKRFLSELEDGVVPINLWYYKETATLDEGTKLVDSILGKDVFDYPKPIQLIQRMIRMATSPNDIIFDFFSGSSTTAHAVMQLNAEDGSNRKFIMVQLPEPCADGAEAAKAGYKNICEIGKERIRRAGEKIKAEIEEQNAQLKIGVEPKKVPDIGFKVFKLDSSNLKQWQPDYDDLETSLFDSISNYVEGRSELDVVYEIMLKMGMELTWPLETHTIGGNNVYEIGMGALMICLDDHITTEVAEGMAALYKELAPETWRVVFKDNGFADDSAKVNIKEILKNAGLEEDAFTTV